MELDSRDRQPCFLFAPTNFLISSRSREQQATGLTKNTLITFTRMKAQIVKIPLQLTMRKPMTSKMQTYLPHQKMMTEHNIALTGPI